MKFYSKNDKTDKSFTSTEPPADKSNDGKLDEGFLSEEPPADKKK